MGLVSSNASITAAGGGPALFGGGGGSTLGNIFQLNRSFAVAGAGPVVKWDIFNYGRLKNKVRYEPIGFELLPRKFTLTQLQQLYETILETELDKRNFRRKLLSMGLLEELDEVEKDVAHRAARLYRFDEKKYRRLAKRGFNFEI